MSTAKPDNAPDSIEGGCLCGAVRYELDLVKNWPPGRHTCQCTQCRKWTGAIVVPFLSVSSEQLTWGSTFAQDLSHTTPPTKLDFFIEYSASPGYYRGFCNKCGSTLSWRSDKEPGVVEITLGSVDERDLLNKMDGELGRLLSHPAGGHFWSKNAIKGVTDLMPGKKHPESSELEEMKG
ncbi:hypothetical protein N7G274_000734 [Stereocaulon virgatum]|uniref:CENP-V/GFA domain-containing protein n=1 Tax=Stereocaulon virgatum TaxID=373712 RepID=A0ABR4APM4_9LECA